MIGNEGWQFCVTMADVSDERSPRQVYQRMVIACREGNIAQLRLSYQQLGQAQSCLGQPPANAVNAVSLVDEAAAFGHRNVLDWLIAQGANISQLNGQHQTIAFSAAARNQITILDYLHQHHLDLNHLDSKAETCIFVAAARGHTETVEWLLTRSDFSRAQLEHENFRRHTVREV